MSDILEIEAHDRYYQIHDPGGIIGNCLRKGSPYEMKVLERIHRMKLTGTAVDVGAGVGNHTLWLAAICNLYVVAFEPLDWRRILANIQINPNLPIRPHPVALGETRREGTVNPAPEHVTGRALDDADEVPIHTLDEYNLTNVSLIKIDVEGMEPEVLKGAANTIDQFHPVLYVEAVDAEAARQNHKCIPKGYVHTGTYGATPLEEWLWQG